MTRVTVIPSLPAICFSSVKGCPCQTATFKKRPSILANSGAEANSSQITSGTDGFVNTYPYCNLQEVDPQAAQLSS